jgi:hypothetical protein
MALDPHVGTPSHALGLGMSLELGEADEMTTLLKNAKHFDEQNPRLAS